MNVPMLTLAVWLLDFLVHSTILLGAVWLIDRFRLAKSSALREHLWRAAVVGGLLTASAHTAGLPALTPRIAFDLTSPSDSRPGHARPVPPLPVAVDAAAATYAARPEAVPASPTRTSSARVAPAPERRLAGYLYEPRSVGLQRLVSTWPALLVAIWLVGAALALVRTARLAMHMRRELGPRLAVDPAVRGDLAELCRTGRPVPTLSVSARIASPITLPTGEIVLPPWTLTKLERRQRRALLAHELAHVARRDPQWILATLLLNALLWPQPLLRTARRRLCEIAEIRADAWAAGAVSDPRSLAECLVECAERLLPHRVARFGAAIAGASPSSVPPLIDRIQRLLVLAKGHAMTDSTLSLVARGTVAAALVSTLFLLPGCGITDLRAEGNNFSSSTRIDDDGDVKITVTRAGYRLKVVTEGAVAFAADESEVATLAPRGEFRLEETFEGVERSFVETADAAGKISRTFERDGRELPFDDEARRWLAAALPRMFRESGWDAEARVGRLLLRGGPELVLAEVELVGSAHAKGNYLGHLLKTAPLSPALLDRALTATEQIDSDFELRSALSLALDTQALDADRLTRLLGAANRLGSDFERAELLVATASRLPQGAADGAAGLDAWLQLANGLGSDFELGRALEHAFQHGAGDGAFMARLVNLAAEKMGSDFELRQALGRLEGRMADPQVASAALAATAELGSDFERREALLDIVRRASLDSAQLAIALDRIGDIDSSFERLSVLEAVAPKVASDADLSRRYRELARSMNGHERGEALRALDDASVN